MLCHVQYMERIACSHILKKKKGRAGGCTSVRRSRQQEKWEYHRYDGLIHGHEFFVGTTSNPHYIMVWPLAEKFMVMAFLLGPP